MEKTGYVIARDTDLPFRAAVEGARELLREAGYGGLGKIDVGAKLGERLSIEYGPYTIPGGCNPPLARRGLDVEPDLGALLPGNVVVYEREGRTRVSAVEPSTMLSVVGNDELVPIAERGREDLARGVDELSGL